MTPAAILKQASADGVRIALTDTGTIKASGDQGAVNRWLPIIREQKPGIVAALREASIVTALQQAANDDTLPDPAAEARRQRVLAMLAERPGIRYAVLTDSQADQEAVLLTLAIRGVGTCELAIPRAKYDGVLLLDLIERHSGTVH